jgi:hypothetical protein
MRTTILIPLILVLPSAATAQTLREKILAAANLPVAAADAREAGVSEGQLSDIFGTFRKNRLPADDAWRVLDGEVRVVKEGGSKENFGAFVQTQLDAGLRGRELAEAIHAEHARRGMGRPDDKGKSGEARGREAERKPAQARPGERQAGEAKGKPGNDRPQQPRDTNKKGRKP